jgi:hypothetical protein
MHMVRLGIDLDRRATEIAEDAAEVGTESRPQVVWEQALAVLRAEDEVDVNFGERLRHGGGTNVFLRSFRAHPNERGVGRCASPRACALG